MNNHIDQLTEWWENAEVPTSATLPKDGDRIIIRYNSEWYEIATADGDADVHELSSYTRILARAPKPTPAWHDAVAVIAQTAGRDDRRAFIRGDDGWWEDADCSYEADELAYVTPLIEAKVTDEMIDRVLDVIAARFDNYPAGFGEEIAVAALGIEEGS